jgi:hypothetical protein
MTGGFLDAVTAFRLLIERRRELLNYALPWFGIVIVMALPLPFLGVLEFGQRPSASGLDFSTTATLLALLLNASIWCRAELQASYPGGVPFPCGLRELIAVFGGLFLVVPPLWLWSEALGLLTSLDVRFAAIHRLAGWFGRLELIEFGFDPALQIAAAVIALLALLATAISLRFAYWFCDVVLEQPASLSALWRLGRRGRWLRQGLALLLSGLPFGLMAFGTDHLGSRTDNPVVIGILEIFGTAILFPLSAIAAIILARGRLQAEQAVSAAS